MVPHFDDNGHLPAGIHLATLAEVLERFGRGSEEREACGQSVAWLVPMCRRAGIARVILNGSFVTDRPEPGDVDCIVVPGADFASDSDAAVAIRNGLPYLSVQLVETDEELDYFANVIFASDRSGRPKGLVEVIL